MSTESTLAASKLGQPGTLEMHRTNGPLEDLDKEERADLGNIHGITSTLSVIDVVRQTNASNVALPPRSNEDLL